MAKVYLKNTNDYPLVEMFKGEKVEILANDYWRDKKGEKKILDIYEANDFRGQYHPVPFDGSGKMEDHPKYYKKVAMEPCDDEGYSVITADSGFKCMAKECKHVSASSEELETHTKVKHGSMETLILPEEDAKPTNSKWKR